MSIRRFFRFAAVAGTVVFGATAQAQDAFLGQQEFQQRCAICHGEAGAGDGVVGELFAHKPKDLRMLARENDGMYPFNTVFESIDGRRDVAAHGSTQMPIWGDYLMQEAVENRGIDKKDAAMVVEARILALVQYIQSFQMP